MSVTSSNAKPFVKWVGGKTQLIPQLSKIITDIFPYKIDNYVEPFIGGGALFFWLKSLGKIENAVISDINQDLILTYIIVQQQVQELIIELSILQEKYLSLGDLDKELMYYDMRDSYNNLSNLLLYSDVTSHEAIVRASQFIFLNKTCFNGLYRQNNSGKFNVPFGKYKKPNICDVLNLSNTIHWCLES